MQHMNIARLVVLSFLATSLAACSSSNSDNPTADTFTSPMVDVPNPDTSQQPVNGSGVLFPEMQGSWSRDCLLFDEEEPSEGYERSVITVTGNEFVVDTKVYSDSNCVTPLARGFLQFGDDFQSYGTVERPGGTADTSVGAMPFIDLNFTRFTIEGEPLVPEVAAFYTPYVDYTIVHVDGDQMYLGDPDFPGQDGDTAQTRSVVFDFTDPLTRQ